jgi:hypothetical protein
MYLSLAGLPIRIAASGDVLQRVIEVNFVHLSTDTESLPVLSYHVSQQGECYTVQSGDTILYQGPDLADVVFYLEKDLIIATQLKSKDILFFHAAALTCKDRTVMIVGESGAGKSSVTWGLLQHGFKYLSDEMVPVEPGLRIHSFPRAVNLKSELAAPYGFPADAVDLGRFCMAPVAADKLETNNPAQVDYVLFVKFNRDTATPSLTAISKADAFLLLFKNLLNAKAFEDYGMSGITNLLQDAHCYQLTSVTDMRATVGVIQQLLDSTTS